jgi:hypothetical protein
MKPMFSLTRRKLVATLLLTVVLEYGCGGSTAIKSFRLALAASGPLVNSLVSAGAIPQAKATAIITDFNDGAGCALILQDAFNAIPSELSAAEKKTRKFQASLSALQCFRVIINRQNFAAHPRIQQAANIAEGILASLVVFYSGTGTSAEARSATVIARDEKELERKLKVQVNLLEAALQP